MAVETVKIPKKFADICSLIRDGETAEGLDQLNAYPGLEHQKTAVLAEVAYFNGDFDTALAYGMEICPYWGEWYYSNVMGEHLAAMAFAALQLGRQEAMADFFARQSALVDREEDLPDHIRNARKAAYASKAEFLKTGIVPHFTDDETYKIRENPAGLNELREELKKEKKKLDPDSEEGIFALFKKCCSKGSPGDMLMLYEKIADTNLSTMWHINALAGYNYVNDREKAFGTVLRMARQRLWLVAAATQVRPMEFFTHPSVFPFLKDKDNLVLITGAAGGTKN